MVGSLVFLFAIMACSACALINLLAGGFRAQFVKGSRQRYLMATVQKATQWPGLFAHVLAAGLAARDQAWWDLASAGAGVALWIWFYVWAKNDDDDDWFKGAKKRLKKWVESRSFGLGLAPGSA